VSDEYAAATGVWRAWRQEEVKRQTIHVDRAKLLARAARVRRVIELVDCWLAGARVVNMCYEELLDKNSRSWAALNKVLWRPIEEIKFKSLKTTPPYNEVITNFASIADLLDQEICRENLGA
jgi:hypothetical protein